MAAVNRCAYLAIEGPIGVGKTTLATRLAQSLDAQLLLEAPEDNPFLAAFYADPVANALPAQLFFLLQRARQAEQLRQPEPFGSRWVSDFMQEKDPLFARLTLSATELALYEDLYRRLTWQAPVPDKVLYLYAPVDVLLARVRSRDRAAERPLTAAYLERVAASYSDLFQEYRAAPLVTVDAARRDLVGNSSDYAALLEALTAPAPRVDL